MNCVLCHRESDFCDPCACQRSHWACQDCWQMLVSIGICPDWRSEAWPAGSTQYPGFLSCPLTDAVQAIVALREPA